MKVQKKAVWPVVRHAFPDYKGRKFSLKITKQVTMYDTNWGGGTRTSYAAVNIQTGKTGAFQAAAPWFNTVEGQTIDIPRGAVVIEHSIFCGRDIGITVNVHPDDMPTLLESFTDSVKGSLVLG